MKCKLCSETAVVEKGWLNIAAFMYPLCSLHMQEYIEFKKKFAKKFSKTKPRT